MGKYIIPILEGLLTILIICVAICNGAKNPSFWETSITQILTLLIAVFIAFWATQRKNDERRIKDEIERIIVKIQTVTSDPAFYSFTINDNPEEAQKKVSMTIRMLKNCTAVLLEYSKYIKIKDNVQYIDEQIRGYNDFISVHFWDLEYLSKSEAHLRKYSENINSKCDYIILDLFTKF